MINIHSATAWNGRGVIPINTGTLLPSPERLVDSAADETLHWLMGDVVSPDMLFALEFDDNRRAEGPLVCRVHARPPASDHSRVSSGRATVLGATEQIAGANSGRVLHRRRGSVPRRPSWANAELFAGWDLQRREELWPTAFVQYKLCFGREPETVRARRARPNTGVGAADRSHTELASPSAALAIDLQ